MFGIWANDMMWLSEISNYRAHCLQARQLRCFIYCHMKYLHKYEVLESNLLTSTHGTRSEPKLFALLLA